MEAVSGHVVNTVNAVPRARVNILLDLLEKPVGEKLIGHEFVHGERRRTGERVLGAPVARVGRAVHAGACAEGVRAEQIIIKCEGTFIRTFIVTSEAAGTFYLS